MIKESGPIKVSAKQFHEVIPRFNGAVAWREDEAGELWINVLDPNVMEDVSKIIEKYK